MVETKLKRLLFGESCMMAIYEDVGLYRIDGRVRAAACGIEWLLFLICGSAALHHEIRLRLCIVTLNLIAHQE